MFRKDNTSCFRTMQCALKPFGDENYFIIESLHSNTTVTTKGTHPNLQTTTHPPLTLAFPSILLKATAI